MRQRKGLIESKNLKFWGTRGLKSMKIRDGAGLLRA